MRYLRLPGFTGRVMPPQVTAECQAEIAAEFAHSYEPGKSALSAALAAVQQRVEDYCAASGDPVVIGASPFTRKSTKDPSKKPGDHLFDRYRSGESTDSAIVAKVMSVALPFCPYCGLPSVRKPHGKSPDRDHILPRSKYPEFSILRVNLVPSCDHCNEAKGDKCLDDQGNWLFIHPYFDTFLAGRVLGCTANVEHGAIVVRFWPEQALDRPNRERLGRHMVTLDLERRLAAAARQRVQSALVMMHSMWTSHKDIISVQRALRAAAEPLLRSHGSDPEGLAYLRIADGDTESFLNAAVGL